MGHCQFRLGFVLELSSFSGLGMLQLQLTLSGKVA